MIRCCCCGRMVVYAGPPAAHFSTAVILQDAETHRLHEPIRLPGWQYVVPMFDGQLVLTMYLVLN